MASGGARGRVSNMRRQGSEVRFRRMKDVMLRLIVHHSPLTKSNGERTLGRGFWTVAGKPIILASRLLTRIEPARADAAASYARLGTAHGASDRSPNQKAPLMARKKLG